MTAVVDVHKGWCSMCRRGNHDLCVKDRYGGRCVCDGGVKRGHRPPDPKEIEVRQPPAPAPAAMATNGQAAPPAPRAVLSWEEPPAPLRGRPSDVLPAAVQAELRAHPGKWARVHDYTAKSSAFGRAKAIREGKGGVEGSGWEAAARRSGTGSILYVRFVGRGGA